MRFWSLLFALLGLSWFQFGQSSSAAALAQRSIDLTDPRPARSILILGNSRTFVNDMPSMLRKIADSAGSTTKFQTESNAKPGYTLEDHWSDRRSIGLLRETWDDILIQGESGAQASVEQSASFKQFGAKLASIAKVHRGRPTLIVNWPYDPSVFAGSQSYDRAEHLAFLRETNAALAEHAGLNRINLAGLWESVRLTHPDIVLTSDGNHPTVAGTYLYALATYRGLSQQDVSKVSYEPSGITPASAAVLRHAVDDYAGLTS